MILSDREIEVLLEGGAVLIAPSPVGDQWTSTAVDLTLDSVLLEWTPPAAQPYEPRPKSPDFSIRAMMDDPALARRVTIDPKDGYRLTPGSFVLGYTREKVRLPSRSRVAARVEGKSSLARLGVGVHVTAPTIHAGFGAKTPDSPGAEIQLEIFNLGKWTVILDAAMPICQFILEEVRETPRAGYSGQFSEQRAFTPESPAA